jgi:hypothetical protein
MNRMSQAAAGALALAVVSIAVPSEAALSGYYKILARHSGKALVVQSASTSDGANVVQWT